MTELAAFLKSRQVLGWLNNIYSLFAGLSLLRFWYTNGGITRIYGGKLELQRGLSIELRSAQVLVQVNRGIRLARSEEQLKRVDARITLPFTYNLLSSLPQLL